MFNCQTIKSSDSQQKNKRTCRIMDLVFLVDYSVKIKESEKKKKKEKKWREINIYLLPEK